MCYRRARTEVRGGRKKSTYRPPFREISPPSQGGKFSDQVWVWAHSSPLSEDLRAGHTGSCLTRFIRPGHGHNKTSLTHADPEEEAMAGSRPPEIDWSRSRRMRDSAKGAGLKCHLEEAVVTLEGPGPSGSLQGLVDNFSKLSPRDQMQEFWSYLDAARTFNRHSNALLSFCAAGGVEEEFRSRVLYYLGLLPYYLLLWKAGVPAGHKNYIPRIIPNKDERRSGGFVDISIDHFRVSVPEFDQQCIYDICLLMLLSDFAKDVLTPPPLDGTKHQVGRHFGRGLIPEDRLAYWKAHVEGLITVEKTVKGKEILLRVCREERKKEFDHFVDIWRPLMDWKNRKFASEGEGES